MQAREMQCKATPAGIRVLSLFDGISVGYDALARAGFKIESYYAAETNKYALAVSQHNHPEITQLGCIRALGPGRLRELGQIVLVLAAPASRVILFDATMLHSFSDFRHFFDARVGKFGAAWMRAQTQYLTQARCGSLCVRVPRTLQVFTAAQLQVVPCSLALSASVAHWCMCLWA